MENTDLSFFVHDGIITKVEFIDDSFSFSVKRDFLAYSIFEFENVLKDEIYNQIDSNISSFTGIYSLEIKRGDTDYPCLVTITFEVNDIDTYTYQFRCMHLKHEWKFSPNFQITNENKD